MRKEDRWKNKLHLSSYKFPYNYLVTTSLKLFTPMLTSNYFFLPRTNRRGKKKYKLLFEKNKLLKRDGRCVRDQNRNSPYRSYVRLLAIPALYSRVSENNPYLE